MVCMCLWGFINKTKIKIFHYFTANFFNYMFWNYYYLWDTFWLYMVIIKLGWIRIRELRIVFILIWSIVNANIYLIFCDYFFMDYEFIWVMRT